MYGSPCLTPPLAFVSHFWGNPIGSKAQLFGALLGRVPDAALRQECHSCIAGKNWENHQNWGKTGFHQEVLLTFSPVELLEKGMEREREREWMRFVLN